MKSQEQKILYIITQGKWGGAQKYILDLALHMTKNFDVTIAIGEPHGDTDLQQKIKSCSESGINIVQLKYLRRNISPIADIVAITELRKLYKKLQPHIIHLNSTKAGILGALAHIGIKNIKSIYTAHGWVFNEPLARPKKIIYTWLEKITAHIKNHIIVINDADYTIATHTLHIPPTKLSRIYNGIALTSDNISPKNARQQLKKIATIEIPDTFIVGTIANLYKTKAIDDLIQVARKCPPYTFLVIGDGPEHAHIQKLIHDYNISNVHLLGFMKNAKKYIPAFDLFFLPSRKEGLPYVLLEAISQHVPILATDVGGVSEIISQQKTGLLTAPGDITDMVRQLNFAYKNKERMEIYTHNAQKHLEKNFSNTHMLKRTYTLYQKILDQ